MATQGHLLPTTTDYHALCTKLGFETYCNFVKLTPDGRVGFTIGKPEEVEYLLQRVRECGYVPTRGLLAAVRQHNPRNRYLQNDWAASMTTWADVRG